MEACNKNWKWKFEWMEQAKGELFESDRHPIGRTKLSWVEFVLRWLGLCSNSVYVAAKVLFSEVTISINKRQLQTIWYLNQWESAIHEQIPTTISVNKPWVGRYSSSARPHSKLQFCRFFFHSIRLLLFQKANFPTVIEKLPRLLVPLADRWKRRKTGELR